MALIAIDCGLSHINWGTVIDDLAAQFGKSAAGRVNQVEVCEKGACSLDIFMAWPNFLLAGKPALDYFVKALPKGFHIELLD